ncbi:hypothetical protein K1719_006278 [Acacia pycnantha]|nr:hypothetical protein K1719_006278 [Acacia pycnantha]
MLELSSKNAAFDWAPMKFSTLHRQALAQLRLPQCVFLLHYCSEILHLFVPSVCSSCRSIHVSDSLSRFRSSTTLNTVEPSMRIPAPKILAVFSVHPLCTFRTGPTSLNTGQIFREYELQILFRIEILQSDVGSGVEESSKQKMVKQIFLLLENIQCHMEGGFFADWNLDNYMAKIIKSRITGRWPKGI